MYKILSGKDILTRWYNLSKVQFSWSRDCSMQAVAMRHQDTMGQKMVYLLFIQVVIWAAVFLMCAKFWGGYFLWPWRTSSLPPTTILFPIAPLHTLSAPAKCKHLLFPYLYPHFVACFSRTTPSVDCQSPSRHLGALLPSCAWSASTAPGVWVVLGAREPGGTVSSAVVPRSVKGRM